MIQELIKEWQEKRVKFVKYLEDRCTDPSILKAGVDFLEFDQNLMNAILEIQDLDKAVLGKIEEDNGVLKLVITHYELDRIFDPEKAKKWLINALVLVVRDEYNFNGIFFEKDGKNILKNRILKD